MTRFKTGLLVNIKGGPGSGNFGHAGRPGKQGGSTIGSSKLEPGVSKYVSKINKLGLQTIDSADGDIERESEISAFISDSQKSNLQALLTKDMFKHSTWARGDAYQKSIGSVTYRLLLASANNTNVASFRLKVPVDTSMEDWKKSRDAGYKIWIRYISSALNLAPASGEKGGPGSGFHGHAGRPGKRGGSATSASNYTEVSNIIRSLSDADEQFNDQLIRGLKYVELNPKELKGLTKITNNPPEAIVTKNRRDYRYVTDRHGYFQFQSVKEGIIEKRIMTAMYDPDNKIIHIAKNMPIGSTFVHELAHHIYAEHNLHGMVGKLREVYNYIKSHALEAPILSLLFQRIELTPGRPDSDVEEAFADMYETLRFNDRADVVAVLRKSGLDKIMDIINK